jgi:hypothetical protein
MTRKREIMLGFLSNKLKTIKSCKLRKNMNLLYYLLFTLVSIIYNYVSWKNTFFPTEEASQYFPKSSVGAFFRESYVFDGSNIDGNTLNAIPIGLLTGFLEDNFSASWMILLNQFILNGLVCFALFSALSLFIQKTSFRLMALTCLQFSFVITNYSSYFTKSLSLIFFCLILKIYGTKLRIVPLIFVTCGVSVLTIGMLANLGATFVGWIAFPLAIVLLRKRINTNKDVKFKAIIMLIVTIGIQAPILWKYYISSRLISSYTDFSKITDTRFGSNISILTGDGNWMQFADYEGTKYYNYVIPEGHWSYLVRLLIVLFLLCYILLLASVQARLHPSNSLTSRRIILNTHFRQMDILIVLIGGVILIPVEEIEPLEEFVRGTFLTAFRDPWMKFEGVFLLLLVTRIFGSIEGIFSGLNALDREFDEKFSKNKYSKKEKARLFYENKIRSRIRLIGIVLLSFQVLLTPVTNLSHQFSFVGPIEPAVNVHSDSFDQHKSEAVESVSKWSSVIESKLLSDPIICILASDPLDQAASETFLFYAFENLRGNYFVSKHSPIPKKYAHTCRGEVEDSLAKVLKCDYSAKYIQVASRLCYRQVSKVS